MPFSDPITAGDKLVRNAIQSDTFVTLVSGWQIKRDGSAEFNNASIRGPIHLEDNLGRIDIQPGGAFSQGPEIDFYYNGFTSLIKYTNAVPSLFLTVPSVTNDGSTAQIEIQAAGPNIIMDVLKVSIGAGNQFNVRPLVTETIRPLVKLGETWHSVGWGNGWSDLGAPWAPVQYMMMPDGTVLFRGLGIGGTRTDGTNMFNLPASYLPTYPAHLDASSELNGVTPVVQVLLSGAVTCNHMAASFVIGFDSIRYPSALLG